MSNMTPEQEDRLPAYARQALLALRLQLHDASQAAERARMATKPDESRVLIARYGEPIGLADQEVTFLDRAGDDYVTNGLNVRPYQHGPGIAVRGSGSDALHVIPSSSNVVYIRTGRL